VLLNNGNGTFAAAVTFGVGSEPGSVFAADLDGDGNVDLSTANYGSNNVSVLLNRSVNRDASDVNCDGVIDLVDVVLLGNHLDGIVALSGDCSETPGDVNVDGFVNEDDYTLLYDWIAR
jgi:hypothetical protein